MKFVDWFVAKARAHADMVPAIQAFWHKTAWTLAMALRNSISFGEATRGIMNDVATWQEVVIAHAAPPRRQPPTYNTDIATVGEDTEDRGNAAPAGGNRRRRRRRGQEKGKGRDGKDTADPPRRTETGQDQTWWTARGGGKNQNQQAWWSSGGRDTRRQDTEGTDRPWKRATAGKGRR